MLSKLLRPLGGALVARRAPLALGVPRARYSDLIPPTQYDPAFPKRLNLGYAMRVYWEIIPLVITTVVSLSLSVGYSLWCCVHKVDLSFASHSLAGTISRTMDLRNPEVHKIIVINQRYEPWPEMQDVLDKMAAAEKRALVRMQSCSNP